MTGGTHATPRATPPATAAATPAAPRFLPRFTSPLHDARSAVSVGRLLGLAIAVCFLTGLVSHVYQHPASWLPLPSRPVWGYRVTQGLHVVSGVAAVPLLLAKLWAVYPRLFAWPPARSVTHALERAGIAVLVAGSLFELVTGLVNITRWYPWPFFFTVTHYWVAWVIVGALLLHLAVKAPVIYAHWRRPAPEGQRPPEGGLSRRSFLGAVGVATGAAAAVTVGQSYAPLRPVNVVGARAAGAKVTQGLTITRTAAEARIRSAALDPGWRLEVVGPRPYRLTLDELSALPQHTVELPVTCVEGWSQTARWTGVRLRDLLERAGARHGAEARMVSLERSGLYRTSTVGSAHAWDELTLVAVRLGGQALDLDHGYPARLIAPSRPGVLQTKWLARVEVLP